MKANFFCPQARLDEVRSGVSFVQRGKPELHAVTGSGRWRDAAHPRPSGKTDAELLGGSSRTCEPSRLVISLLSGNAELRQSQSDWSIQSGPGRRLLLFGDPEPGVAAGRSPESQEP